MVTNTVLLGDALEQLKTLPSDSVDCCVTSPPYYALRDYGTGIWVGGDPNCDHVANSKATKVFGNPSLNEHRPSRAETKVAGYYRAVCPKCGAIREDKQIGLEESPEAYVSRLTEVFREVKRVLKPSGTFWLNIGDSYWGSGSRGFDFTGKMKDGVSDIQQGSKGTHDLSALPKLVGTSKQGGYKPKDLIGIPWMLAFALREDGWYLRQDIIWAKTNCMPESVTDRCVKSHEYLFLLTKSPKYFFDHKAIQTPSAEVSKSRATYSLQTTRPDGMNGHISTEKMGERFVPEMANKRDVWRIAASTFKGAHFATFPEALVEPCILAGCPVGGVVLDPFFGSGTTGRVAIQTNRQYIGIELNPEYIELSNERTTNIQLSMSGLI